MTRIWLASLMAVTLAPAIGLADPPARDVPPTTIKATPIKPTEPLELSTAQLDMIRSGTAASTTRFTSSNSNDYRNANKPNLLPLNSNAVPVAGR